MLLYLYYKFRFGFHQAARVQEVALNPTKLAGQCGKLKCCLNYEVDSYADARKHFPDRNIYLKVKNGRAVHQKTDVYRGVMWYALETDSAISSLVPVPVERVTEIINLNKKNVFPDTLIESYTNQGSIDSRPEFRDVVGQESINRFETRKKKNKNRKKKRPGNQKNNSQ